MFDFPQTKLEELVHQTHKLVEEAIERRDGPFAALLVNSQGQIVLTATNTTRSTQNVTAHAEINLIEEACQKFQTLSLGDYGVITNAAPCSMCMTAMIKAKITEYYYSSPMEEMADPALTPEEVAAKSKLNIRIGSGLLKLESQTQIKRGRDAMDM